MLPSKRTPISWQGCSLWSPSHIQWSTSHHTLSASTAWSYTAAAFHRIQHLRRKKKEFPKKSLVQNIPASSLPRHPAAWHLFLQHITPCLPQHWPIRDESTGKEKSNSKHKAPNPAIFSPNKIPVDKNITFTLYPLCNILLVVLMDSCLNLSWRVRRWWLSLKLFQVKLFKVMRIWRP